MIRVALEYRRPIDLVTADKGLKLRKYELDDEEWIIIKDLIDVLEVCFSLLIIPVQLTDISCAAI
jgi:hypothetical protein